MKLEDITDGSSNTILILEVPDSKIKWMEPRDITYDDAVSALRHGGPGAVGNAAGRSYCLFADGSVYTLSADISPEVAKALLSATGGEEIPRDQLEK